MSAERKRSRLVIALVALWVVFTVTLAGWWLIFGLRQLDLINQSKLEGDATTTALSNADVGRRHSDRFFDWWRPGFVLLRAPGTKAARPGRRILCGIYS